MQDRSRLAGPVVLLAAAAAVAVLSSLDPTVAAAGAGATPTAFCTTARDLAESYERIDETDPDESVEDIGEAEGAYRRLADQAPPRLRTPIRRILAFFPILEDASSGELDISDRKEGQRYVKAAAKAAKAFDAVFRYLDRTCKLDID